MQEKFSVTGMTCSACSSGIERAVRRLSGVKSADVSLMGESMSVEYDEALVTVETIIQTVQGLGYGATKIRRKILFEERNKSYAIQDALFFIFHLFIAAYVFFHGRYASFSATQFESFRKFANAAIVSGNARQL